MSWDLYVMEVPATAASVADIPHDFKPGPLMSRQDLIDLITEVVPSADFSDPTWGFIEQGMIEVAIGEQDPVESFAFHVRGSDAAVEVIESILARSGLRAIDASTGEFFDPVAGLTSYKEWRAYRDRVIGPSSDD